MNNKIISIVVVLILLGGGFLLFKNKTVAPTNEEVNKSDMMLDSDGMEDSMMGVDVEDSTMMEGSGMMENSGVKEFVVEGVPFSFTPSTITVNKGDTVKIIFKNLNGTHDLKIDEFNVATKITKTGEQDTVTFVADKTGVFEYYCSVGNHRAMGMVGKLTVK